MPEVKKVTVELQRPSKRYPSGMVTFGYYTITGDVLAMTDPKGKLAEDGIGKRYTYKLAPGESENGVACKLTKQLRLALRGSNPSAPKADFWGKINYPKTGWM